MNVPQETAVDFPTALSQAWRDVWLRAAVAALAILSLPYLIPVAWFDGVRALRGWVTTASPSLFLALLIPSYLLSRRAARDVQERKFWSDLALAFGVWLLLRVSIMPTLDPDRFPLLRELMLLMLYLLVYVLQLVAAERQPHRANVWRPRGLERAVLLPALVLFVLILGSYFVIVPAVVAPLEFERDASSFHLYMFFDTLLALRFLYLSRIADSLRWRLIYIAYGAGSLLFLVSNALEWQIWLRKASPDWTTPVNALWSLPFLLLALPPAFSRVRFAPRTAGPRILEPWHGTLAGSSRVTMTWALLLPMTHIALYHFELLDPVSRTARRDLVLACVVLLGIAAMVQQRVLVQRTRVLWRERQNVERNLRTSENDLRLMVERTRASEQLAAEDEKFARAFRVHHDGLAISLLETGEIIDVNPAFETLTDIRREQLLGQVGMDTGLWPSGRDRESVVRVLEERGHLRNVEAEIATAGGDTRVLQASFELLYDRRQRYMMTVLHDVSAERRAEHRLRRHAAFLDEAAAALLAVDAEGRVDYWNPAAAELFGLTEEDRRRTLERLLVRSEDEVWLRSVDLDESGGRAGRLVLATASARLGEDAPAKGPA